MFKIDQIKRLFDCDICNSLLIDPVQIPCGNTVCKSHVRELLERRPKQKDSFVCEFCEEEHVVPVNGFAVNKRMKSVLDSELNNLTIDMPTYNRCKRTIEEAKENAEKLESISKDPESFIVKYFEQIKNEVYLRREKLKVEIDQHSEEIIERIDGTQKRCIELSKKVGVCVSLEAQVERSENDLQELIKEFDTFDISEKKFEDIQINADGLKEKLGRVLVEYKETLLENKEFVYFVAEEMTTEKLIGSFQNTKVTSFFRFILIETF